MESVAEYIQKAMADNISSDAVNSMVELRFRTLIDAATGWPANAIIDKIKS